MIMRKQRLRKKHIPSFYFTKVLKRRSVIEELFTVPIILEMMNGEFFAGAIDDYLEGRTIAIFAPHQLIDKEISEKDPFYTERMWEDHSKEIFEYFSLKDIKNIYRAKDESLLLSQILELVLNPFQKPVKVIECDWRENGKHSDNCDEDLHEALAKCAKAGTTYYKSKNEQGEFQKAFDIIRRFIIDNNGRIP